MSGMVARIWALVIWFWGLVSRPATYLSLGFLTLGGFVFGVLFLGCLQHGVGVDEYGEVLRLLS